MWLLLKRWTVIIKAEIDQIIDTCRANTHYRIGTTPVNFDATVIILYRTAGKNNIVYVTRYLPGVFRGQYPFVGDADNFRGIVRSCKATPRRYTAPSMVSNTP